MNIFIINKPIRPGIPNKVIILKLNTFIGTTIPNDLITTFKLKSNKKDSMSFLIIKINVFNNITNKVY